jgi:hypothetical protein
MADASRDKVMRFSSDLVDAAAAEGARQSRSSKQQLDHWVRLGRAVSSYTSVSRQRVEAALAGEQSLAGLSNEQSVVFNAEVTARIEENLAERCYGSLLAAAGITTVALDDQGRLVEHRPDGSTAVLPTQA